MSLRRPKTFTNFFRCLRLGWWRPIFRFFIEVRMAVVGMQGLQPCPQ